MPAVLFWLQDRDPPEWAIPLLGLSAFGPTIAAVIVASRRGETRTVFRPWRTNPIWIVLALFTPMALQLVAVCIEVLLGGHPSSWVHLPSTPEQITALVVFSIGEEFGWRGYAQPRLEKSHGPIVGSLIVGVVWAVWHLFYLVSPDTHEVDPWSAGIMLSLPMYSIVFAWFLRRSGGSLAIALALHAGGHLDSMARIPPEEFRLRMITLLVIAVAACLAGRSLLRKPQ